MICSGQHLISNYFIGGGSEFKNISALGEYEHYAYFNIMISQSRVVNVGY